MGGGTTKELAVSGDRDAPTQVFEFPAPAIVEPDLWRRANIERKGKKPTGRPSGRKKYRYTLSQRVKHVHDLDEAPTMFGQMRTNMATPSRFYRCLAWKATEQRPAYCPGLGEYDGQKLTAVPADRLEAHVLRTVLGLSEDPDRLAAYARHADSLLIAQAEGEPDSDQAKRRLERLKQKRARYVDAYAEGLIEKDQLDERMEVLDAEVEMLEGALTRLADIDSQRHAIEVTIEQLLSMRVKASSGQDPTADIEVPRGSSQWFHELRQAAQTSLAPQPFDRARHLPQWAVEETEALAEALGLVVWVGANPGNPRWPNDLVEFDPTLASFKAGCRNDQAPHPASVTSVKQFPEMSRLILCRLDVTAPRVRVHRRETT